MRAESYGRAPLLAVVLLVVCVFFDALLSSYPVGPFPPRVYAQAVLLLLVAGWTLGVAGSVRVSIRDVSAPVALCLCLGWILVVTATTGFGPAQSWDDSVEGLLFTVSRTGAGFLLGLVVTLVCASRHQARTAIAWAVIIGVSISAAVAILQWLRFPAAWALAAALGRLEMQEAGSAVLSAQVRPVGLAASPINLSYHLVLAWGLAAWMARGAKRLGARIVLSGFAVLFVIALIANGTRSALLPVAAVALWMLFGTGTIAGRLLRVAIGSAILLIAVLLAPSTFSELLTPVAERLQSTGSQSDRSRFTFVRAGMAVVAEHPWGTGVGGRRQALAAQVVEFRSDAGSDFLVRTTVHNQPVDLLMTYGIAGLSLILVFYSSLVRAALAQAGSDCEAGGAIVHGSAVGFLLYLISSFAHTGGPFSGDPFVWYTIGLMFSSVVRTVPARSSEERS